VKPIRSLIYYIIMLLIVTAFACTTAAPEPSGTVTRSADGDWAELMYDSMYRVQNNTWNIQAAVGKKFQRVFLADTPAGDAFGWQWDLKAMDIWTVVAYPEVIYGIKPWEAETRPDSWQVAAGQSEIIVDFAVKLRASGIYNMAFSLWAYTDPDMPKDSISHEIMIWNDAKGMVPAGKRIKTALIDGRKFEVYIREGHVDASGGSSQVWSYAAFKPVRPYYEGTLNIKEFIAFLVAEGFMTGEEYLSSVEWGNEVVSGRGLAEISRFSVTVGN
jgi:hypothetical protein